MGVLYKGDLEKVTWRQVREQVLKVNPELAALIDQLDPNDKHWLVKVTYPYGSLVMEKSVLAIPNCQGNIVPITDPSIDKDIRAGIDYNLNSNPVSIVLRNSFEIFLPLEDRTIPLSGLITPGTAFGAWRVLNPETSQQPAFLWDMTAGARSVFMLPKITEGLKHKKLERTFGISASIPRTLMQHWDVFRELANSSQMDDKSWSAEVLYFSSSWFEHLNESAWNDFYHYFYCAGWAGTEFWRNVPVWNLIYSLIIKDYPSRPNGYIMDTVKYLLNVGVGAAPGFGPSCDTLAGPWEIIQDIYRDIYDIRNYPPIIIQPQVFSMENPQASPVYYSLQFPNALEFKPSSRMRTSIISDLHEIRSLLRRCKQDLLSGRFNIQGTSMSILFNQVNYDYFHSSVELHEGMLDTSKMACDEKLRTTLDGVIHDSFPASCLFGKGCIRVSPKEVG